MDDLDVVKAAAEAGMRPFANLVEQLFGGAAQEIGGMAKDYFAARRIMRQIPLFKRVKAAIDKAGFDPRQISDKISVPLLQAALVEDDETMQERWANLLANAADPRQENPVLPSFSEMLKELTPRDAKFLDALYRNVVASEDSRHSHVTPHVVFTVEHLSTVYVEAGLSRGLRLFQMTYAEAQERAEEIHADVAEFFAVIDVLRRNRILNEITRADPIDLTGIARQIQTNHIPPSLQVTATVHYQITELGAQFIRACRAPRSDDPVTGMDQ